MSDITGRIGFGASVVVNTADMATWSPERIRRFFAGLAQAQEAIGAKPLHEAAAPQATGASELNDLEAAVLRLETRVKTQADLLDATVRATAGHGDMLEAMADEIAKLHSLVVGMGDRIAAQSEALSKAAERDADADIVLGPQHFIPHDAPEPLPMPTPSTNGHAAKAQSGIHVQAHADRLRIAALLADRPHKVGEAVAATGFKEARVGYLLANSPWFVRVTPTNRLSPYTLTDAGRAALAAEGYVLVPPAQAEPAAETKPAPEETKVAEPETKPPEVETPVLDFELLTGSARARAECRLIAQTILAAGAEPLAADQIAARCGLPYDLVVNRLLKQGPQSVNTVRYFCKSQRHDGCWRVTNSGEQLVAKEGAQQQ